jgi:tetratricopeptide (TPR) repeat protein/CHAT domain-containing protein
LPKNGVTIKGLSTMPQLYDLGLTLTPPPAAAPEGTIAELSLRCDALGLQPNTSQLLHDPFTTKERDELVWYLEHFWEWPYDEFAQRGQRVEQLLVAAGKRLYDAVFAPVQSIVTTWNLLPDAERQISIISTVLTALSLPWELLHDEQGFLALRTKHPVTIIRRLPQTQLGALPVQFTLPLRVLLVTARPNDAGFVDPRGIARELLDEVEARADIALEFLRPPTREALRARLSQDPPVHILHFDGHGTFDEAAAPNDAQRLHGGAQGKLAFENDDGKLDLVPAEELAQMLQDSGVRLAVLTACQSAKGAQDDLFSSVAARLIRSGVDAVVAMSASVLVASATRYVEAFYRRLAAGEAVPLAHERARQALHDKPERHRHQRRRNEAATPVKLKDWWLPHFYQQRPLNLTVAQTVSLRRSDQQLPEEQARLSPPSQTDSLRYSLPPAPLYGFTGRARELHQIERWLWRGCAVVIHGFGGMGKTTLAREAAEWLMRTGMYDQTCFVSFEHGGETGSLLSALGHRLGVDFDSRDTAAALAALRPVLRPRQKPGAVPRAVATGSSVLIIADNLESLLPGGEAPLDAAARTELWDVLLRLNQMGAGVILTSRDNEFGDGRMAHGKTVKHHALRGLHPEDAYLLVEQLCQDIDIPLTRAPYPDVRDLLVQLDHHPLAIQLVFTQLRDATLTVKAISENFAALLPRFTDDNETGRNRSLLASLEYSLRRLSASERELLLRLAPFEGGASEDDLLAITEIAESDWRRLRVALERAALLTAEQIENVSAPFLRFHPVLAPYLRRQTDTEDAALRSRYAARYHAVANYLYQEDDRNPLAVRELARREMPNLRRALDVLLADGALDEATELVTYIVWFLNFLGLWRERDELRRRVNEAVAAVARTDGALTQAEWLRESGSGEDEFARGNLRAAYARFTALCERIEALPDGAPLGPGSYQHCTTLHWLARCLRAGGQPGAAEAQLRRALAVIEALLGTQPENRDYLRQRGVVQTELGDVLRDQGNFAAAQAAYEAGLKSAEQLDDKRQQGVVLGQLGTLALMQRDYDTARERYREALRLDQTMGEPLGEAIWWHQLGMVAEEQCVWAEAERCYRASLEIKERHGNAAGAATTCNQLAIVAVNDGRPVEAVGWFQRALNAPDLPPSKIATYSNNLADLLTNEVRAGRLPPGRLAEARDHAERALKIMETLDDSAGIWATEGILADIAEMTGEPDAARAYRRRERASFAAFAGNRWHIDQQFSDLIQACAAAALGNTEARAAVEAVLPQLEANGWHITAALQRLWAGERDWHALAEDLDPPNALLVKRVLETIEG